MEKVLDFNVVIACSFLSAALLPVMCFSTSRVDKGDKPKCSQLVVKTNSTDFTTLGFIFVV